MKKIEDKTERVKKPRLEAWEIVELKALVRDMLEERRAAPVVNLDEPERNCLICGYDHSHLTEKNIEAYRRKHVAQD